MKLSDKMMFIFMNRRQTTTGSKIAGMCVLLFAALALILAGAITGVHLFIMLCAIGAVINAVTLIILIAVNVRRNRPRW